MRLFSWIVTLVLLSLASFVFAPIVSADNEAGSNIYLDIPTYVAQSTASLKNAAPDTPSVALDDAAQMIGRRTIEGDCDTFGPQESYIRARSEYDVRLLNDDGAFATREYYADDDSNCSGFYRVRGDAPTGALDE